MTSIPSKTLEVSPGITYRYFYSRAARADLPTILFLHGFPSTAADFRPQLEHFAARGCGELEVPVLIVGFGRDEMTAAGLQDEMTRPWARAGYRFEVLDTGHWVMLEDAAGTNRLLEEFVDGLS
ncbi:uncharacterized protein LY79DRAFT_636085 [Colletotrichum navitas]|uniref:Epoxide hydrolase n=1 Tax=Colletotrichum navitas TaxID=681940 RepID=A0AAD8PVV0_9PEZI|nr:uncharacterized protein LY79DRAFT_636085 [Colletotrichum navitas]KAK1584853.1 hypothetical protein LY79DRAFT_636085 [Colletotrichum navitas]